MTTEIFEFTWQSLNEYIERRITGVLSVLQSLRDDPQLQNLDTRYTTTFERELAMLRQCSALAIELQGRDSLRDISPILSLNILRLRCPYRHGEEDGFLEFAWITLIAEGQYKLVKIGMNESSESDNLQSITQIVQEVEKLVEENCVNESQ